MNLTEVHIKLPDPGEHNSRIRAYCTVVVDGALVVRDIKIIAIASGRLLVTMPNRELRDRCPGCSGKNGLRVRYCGWCGAALDPNRAWFDKRGEVVQYADVCHPVSPGARADFEAQVLEAYALELEASRDPAYRPGRDSGRYQIAG